MSARPRPRPSRGVELVVVISDIHAGSTVALMPPRFELSDGNVIEANAVQRWFWKCWSHAQGWLSEIVDGSPFALVLNGDLVEGDHHRTDQIISKRLTDHVECARAILDPLAKKAARIFITKGTECHTGDTEATVGYMLQAERDPETGRRVFDRLTLDVCGCRFVARHHVTTTSRPWLEANGLGMELASEQLHSVRNGEPLPQVLAVAHRHVGGHIATNEGLCLATPAWQALTRHGHKVVGAARCKTGLYVLDWREVERGHLPRVHRRIYEAPHPQAIPL
jgi:hypothetical protein